MHDVLIVGGGPAGLSAALILGRCGRSTLLYDEGKPRNLATCKVNGYLAVPDCSPAELRDRGHSQLRELPHVEVQSGKIDAVKGNKNGFFYTTSGGEQGAARKLLICVGLRDDIPAWPGVDEHYGRGVYTCPYCDAWENRNQPLAVYGKGSKGYGFAFEMTIWSSEVTLISDGPAEMSPAGLEALERHGVKVREEKVTRLIGDGAAVKRLEFRSGSPLECTAVFLATHQASQSHLAEQLGCKLDEKQMIHNDRRGATSVPGVFAAGDVDTHVGTQMAIAAAADGARAAQAINEELLRDALGSILDIETKNGSSG